MKKIFYFLLTIIFTGMFTISYGAIKITPTILELDTNGVKSNYLTSSFSVQGGQTYLVLANTTTGKVPTAAAIADCKAAAPVAANNANAIAYPIASVSLDNSGTATYDATKNQYSVTANGGTTIATTTTGTAPYSGTYSFQDNAGTYQAIMTLTATSL